MLCQFQLCSKVNQLYIYIYPLSFGFPSHLGHRRALGRVPCAIQQVLISYLFYTQCQQCIYVNPNLPIGIGIDIYTLLILCIIVSWSSPSHPPLPLGIHMFVLYLGCSYLVPSCIPSEYIAGELSLQFPGCQLSAFFTTLCCQCYLALKGPNFTRWVCHCLLTARNTSQKDII